MNGRERERGQNERCVSIGDMGTADRATSEHQTTTGQTTRQCEKTPPQTNASDPREPQQTTQATRSSGGQTDVRQHEKTDGRKTPATTATRSVGSSTHGPNWNNRHTLRQQHGQSRRRQRDTRPTQPPAEATKPREFQQAARPHTPCSAGRQHRHWKAKSRTKPQRGRRRATKVVEFTRTREKSNHHHANKGRTNTDGAQCGSEWAGTERERKMNVDMCNHGRREAGNKRISNTAADKCI